MLDLSIIDDTISSLTPYSYYGDGIVINGGGPIYFINAYLNIKLLRKLGCVLPIEWFYIPGEITDKQRKAAEELDNVVLREIVNLPGLTSNLKRDGGGWQSKFFAVLQSSFQNVLYVDSDSFSIIDPSFLFNCEEFKKYGLIMWYDGFEWKNYTGWFGKNIQGLYDAFPSIKFNTPRTFETGQLIINKNTHYKALCYTVEFNRWWHITYPWSLGDKESLYIGVEMCSSPYFAVPRFLEIKDHAFIHYAPDCLTHLFSHCYESKWDQSCKCHTSSTILPHYKEMEQWCKELVQKIQ